MKDLTPAFPFSLFPAFQLSDTSFPDLMSLPIEHMNKEIPASCFRSFATGNYLLLW
ncbi:hypothetical protein ACTL6P_15945 [Endozoicomonas acroporae]|uniref:hypothetical protein n=1 Tax=Endozoicomonas acroporae TaxID=1701104 RepID=UPI0013CF5F91|nr:hypothetical protein [Endozoicomonas acroporae]